MMNSIVVKYGSHCPFVLQSQLTDPQFSKLKSQSTKSNRESGKPPLGAVDPLATGRGGKYSDGSCPSGPNEAGIAWDVLAMSGKPATMLS